MDSKEDAREAFDRFESPLPDLAQISDRDLKELIQSLAAEEDAISCRRSVIQGHLDILRAERVARFRQPPAHLDVGSIADALLRKSLRPQGTLAARLDQLRIMIARAERPGDKDAYRAGLADALAVLEGRPPTGEVAEL